MSDLEQRAATGKAARAVCSLADQARWDPSDARSDPVDLLEQQAATRVAELVPIRYGRMAVSPFAFFRGAALVMAADLSALPHSGLTVQLGGDAHLANFGGFASPSRDLVFDMNDFDETCPGPFEWDVKRLAASFAVALRQRGEKAKVRRAVVLGTVGEYRQAVRRFATMGNLDVWYARLDVAGAAQRWQSQLDQRGLTRARKVIARAVTRDSLAAVGKLTERVGGRLRIVSRPPLLVPIEEILSAAELAEAQIWVADLVKSYGHSLQADRRHLLHGYRFVHLARKVVGVGSVGTRCWIALFMGRDDGDPLMLQFKEAQASVLEAFAARSGYANHGQRVVEGQRLTQAASDIFLGWDRVTGFDGVVRDYYVRQLWDRKVGPDVESASRETLAVYGEMCGWTLARAHARTGDRVALAAYLGGRRRFEEAIADYAESYADQNERDHAALVDAVRRGRVGAETGI